MSEPDRSVGEQRTAASGQPSGRRGSTEAHVRGLSIQRICRPRQMDLQDLGQTLPQQFVERFTPNLQLTKCKRVPLAGGTGALLRGHLFRSAVLGDGVGGEEILRSQPFAASPGSWPDLSRLVLLLVLPFVSLT